MFCHRIRFTAPLNLPSDQAFLLSTLVGLVLFCSVLERGEVFLNRTGRLWNCGWLPQFSLARQLNCYYGIVSRVEHGADA